MSRVIAMGKVGNWLFKEMFPLVHMEYERFQFERDQAQLECVRLKGDLSECKSHNRALGTKLEHDGKVRQISQENILMLKSQLSTLIIEHESLKKKIVEKAKERPIIKAKSSADARRLAEQAAEEPEDGV